MKSRSLRRSPGRKQEAAPEGRPIYLSKALFSKIQGFGKRFNDLVSQSSNRIPKIDEDDLSASIKVKPRRPPPPWLAKKMYGDSENQEREPEREGNQEETEEETPSYLRKRLR